MRQVSLRVRLLGGFVAVCALLIGVTLIGIRTSREQGRIASQIDQLLVLTRNMGQVKYRISDISGWQLSYAWEASWLGGRQAVAEGSPSRRAFEDSMTALDRELNAVERGPVNKSEEDLLADVRRLAATFETIDDQIVRFFREGTPEGTRQANELVLGASYETSRQIQLAISKLVVSVSERSTAAQKRSQESSDFGRQIQLAGTLIALVLASAISFLINRSIVVSVREIVNGLEKLVEHEFSPQLPSTGRDELTAIARAFNRTAVLLETAHVEQRDLTNRLRELAYRDPLTGLLNRAEFFDRVDAAVARAKDTKECVATLLIDLDDFKPVNDTYGHAAGDAVLRAVAERVRNQIRSTDNAARLGGDEFAVLVEGTNARDFIGSLVLRLQSSIRVPIKIGTARVTVTASIGAGVDCDGLLSGNELLESADTAMYLEKRRRKRKSRRRQGRRHPL